MTGTFRLSLTIEFDPAHRTVEVIQQQVAPSPRLATRPHGILTPGQRQEIIHALHEGADYTQVAQQYGVKPKTIRNIGYRAKQEQLLLEGRTT